MSVLTIDRAALAYGSRELWSGLDLAVEPGEFLAVLGANGSGKTSLLRCVVGSQTLSSGSITVGGRPTRLGNRDLGYLPQHRRYEPLTTLRAQDVVRQGLDGHRWGFARPGRVGWDRVHRALDDVGLPGAGPTPIGLMSGGEQQRVRVAQALVGDPSLLLCDEPLVSLDLASQRTVTRLVDERRRRHGTAIVFVTHEINPVLPYVDRVLYLADGAFRLGPVDEVMTSETLSELYRAPVDVIRSQGRILVAGVPDERH